MYKRERLQYNKTYYTSHKLGVAIGDREKEIIQEMIKASFPNQD